MYYIDAFTHLFLWLSIFYYMRMFSQLSYLVRVVMTICQSLGPFLFIYYIVSIGFGGGFYTAS